MYNNEENSYNQRPGVKYYTPNELSRICRQNPDTPLRENETFLKKMKHSEQERDRHEGEEEMRKERKDRKKHKREYYEDIMPTYEQYYMMRIQQNKKDKKHKRHKEFSELNYRDIQCLINDYNRDILREDPNESKKNQRSRSIDQIPTRDVPSENKTSRKSDRPRSAERREEVDLKKMRDIHARHFAHQIPQIPQEIFYQMNEGRPAQFYPYAEQIYSHTMQKKYKKRNRRHKHVMENEPPDFISIDQVNEQTMNIPDSHGSKWYDKDPHRQHHEHEEYHQQHFKYDAHIESQQAKDENLKVMKHNIEDGDENERNKKKEKRKEKGNDKKRENDKEYKTLKKYLKKLMKEQDKNLKGDVEMIRLNDDTNKKSGKEKKYEELLQQYFALSTKPDNDINEHKKRTKNQERIHHRKHEHKKHKTKKEVRKSLSFERFDTEKHLYEVYQSKNIENNEINLKTKNKSESSVDSFGKNDKNLVYLYQSKDPIEVSAKGEKPTKKKNKETLPNEKVKKQKSKDISVSEKTELGSSPYGANQMILPSEHKKELLDNILDMQKRAELFEKAMRKDFPTRPRPRPSRSRHRSRIMNIESNKDVNCYDVGTSTLLDNNFGEILGLLKTGPKIKPPYSVKKKSVFHVKKRASRDDIIERKAYNSGEIIIKGIDTPKIIDTPRRSKNSFPPPKPKINKLECKILSVVAITPGKHDDEEPIKTMSSPQIHAKESVSELRNPSSDKRLERLLKYYKVESQSNVENLSKTSNDGYSSIKCKEKSIKDIIAQKLTAYLKKLENENESVVEIQTDNPDDPTIVKLILPINYVATPGQEIVNRSIEIPKESFSDLNINYDDTNEVEEEVVQIPCVNEKMSIISGSIFSKNTMMTRPFDTASVKSDFTVIDKTWKISSNRTDHFQINTTIQEIEDEKTNRQELSSFLATPTSPSPASISPASPSPGSPTPVPPSPRLEESYRTSVYEIPPSPDLSFIVAKNMDLIDQKVITDTSANNFGNRKLSEEPVVSSWYIEAEHDILEDNLQNQELIIESSTQELNRANDGYKETYQSSIGTIGVTEKKEIRMNTIAKRLSPERVTQNHDDGMRSIPIRTPSPEYNSRNQGDLKMNVAAKRLSPERALQNQEETRVNTIGKRLSPERSLQNQDEGRIGVSGKKLSPERSVQNQDGIRFSVSAKKTSPERIPQNQGDVKKNNLQRRVTPESDIDDGVEFELLGDESFEGMEQISKPVSNDRFTYKTFDVPEEKVCLPKRQPKSSPRKSTDSTEKNNLSQQGISNEKTNITTWSAQTATLNQMSSGSFEYFEESSASKSKLKPKQIFTKKNNAAPKNLIELDSEVPQKIKLNYTTLESKTKSSLIPRRVNNRQDKSDNPEASSKPHVFKKIEPNLDKFQWDYQGEKVEKMNDFDENEYRNSLQKCLNWNIKNSTTVVLSELEASMLNKSIETEKSTEISTIVSPNGSPKKNSIGATKKEEPSIAKTSSPSKDANTSLFLTKNFKSVGQSSYERRKLYDTKIRKQAKKRSVSANGSPDKKSPLVYEVRYFNVFNQSPLENKSNGTRLSYIKSDQNLSSYHKKSSSTSLDSLTSMPSCFLKDSKFRVNTSKSTVPSCFCKESKFGINISKSTVPSCFCKESKYGLKSSMTTVPSCFIKRSKYGLVHPKTEKKSSKTTRIQGLIEENLLYSEYTSNKKPKSRKSLKYIEKNDDTDSFDIKSVKSYKPKTRITVKCSKKSAREPGKKLRIVAKVTNKQKFKNNNENENECHDCQNLTKVSVDKVNKKELCVFFENSKLSSKSENVGDSKGKLIGQGSICDNSISSLTTVVNCQQPLSGTTICESKETVKAFNPKEIVKQYSTVDSGYLTKGAEVVHSETTLNSSSTPKKPDFCCSNIIKGISSKFSQKKSNTPLTKPSSETQLNSKWEQEDLIKLRNQLLFPDVIDDFELIESAKNTELIKYYVESVNDRLKVAIDSISHKDTMSNKSRSVMSLPSEKVPNEERSESIVSGDMSSEYSFHIREGGFYSYQKFIAQNNEEYSSKILSKLPKPSSSGDGNVDVIENLAMSRKPSSIASTKKSVIELFKIRPSSAKKSTSSVLSSKETLTEETIKQLKTNMSDEEYFNNFHQIMALECQKFAKKVKDQSKCEENEDNKQFKEIPLDYLLQQRHSSVNCLDSDYKLAPEEIKHVEALDENIEKVENSTKTKVENTKFNLDFYSEEKISIIDMIKSAHLISADSLDIKTAKVSDLLSSGDISKQSEKQFFDNLLAFYDKETELIKKLMRDDDFFLNITEMIKNSEDSTTVLFMKDSQNLVKKEKKKGILSRFFRWKEKRNTETLYECSIGKSLEFAKSLSGDSTSIREESCFSFYRDLEDLEKELPENLTIQSSNSEYFQQLARKAKNHLEPMVKATMSNQQISDKIKLSGFLKLLDLVAKGDFTFLNNGENKSLEEKMREHVAHMFEKVYKIADRENVQRLTVMDNEKIQLLKILVTRYHMGIDSHINILAIYIGRGLIKTLSQLEDSILYLMGLDTQEVNLEQFERNCRILNQVN